MRHGLCVSCGRRGGTVHECPTCKRFVCYQCFDESACDEGRQPLSLVVKAEAEATLGNSDPW